MITYKEYPTHTKTYVVVHYTGNGVMEDRFVEHEVVYETNNKKDAEQKAKELTIKHNTKKEIKSTWKSHTYMVHVNTSSKKGNKLYDEWSIKFNDKIEYAQNHPDEYSRHDVGEYVVYSMKCSGWGCDNTKSSFDFYKSGFMIPLNQ